MPEQPDQEQMLVVAHKFLVNFADKTGLDQQRFMAACESDNPEVFLENVSWLMKSVRFVGGLLSDLERGYLWFTRPNSNELFGGATPIEYLRGSDPARFKTLYLFLLSHHEFTV